MLAGLAASGGTFYQARREADRLFDYHLRQLALSRTDAPFEQADLLGTLDQEAEFDFVIQIWDEDGVHLYSSRPHAPLGERTAPGYQRVTTQEGVWRVYSSGAGIAVRLVHHCFLGLRRGRTTLGIDPMIPKALDGLCANVELDGRAVQVRYRVATKGCGPRAVTLNGYTLPMARQANPYRTAGVTIPITALREHLGDRGSELVVDLE